MQKILGITILGIFLILSLGFVNNAAAHTGINDALPSTNRPNYVYSTINAPCNVVGWHPTNPALDLGGDSDGDGICNLWETASGLLVDFMPPAGQIGAGIRFTYNYTCGAGAGQDPQCPSPNKKDVYLELDWMKDPANSHAPLSGVVQAVKDAYAASPVANPDGTTGIILHVQNGEWPASGTASHQGDIKFHKDSIFTNQSTDPLTPGFYRLKQYTFGTVCERFADTTCPTDTGTSLHINNNYTNNSVVKNLLTAKFQVFHYAMIINKRTEQATSTGWAEIYGNDHVWSLGAASPVMGSANMQKAVFMHELGHNFNLDHGGGIDSTNGPADSIPNKPNYFSVMNQNVFEFAYPDVNGKDPCRPLDYSRKSMSSLNEASLHESDGVRDPSSEGYLYPTAPWSCSKTWSGNAAGASLADQPTPVNVAGTERFLWYSTPGSSTLNAFDRTNQGVNWNNDVPADDSDTVTNQDINAQGGNAQNLVSTDDWTRITYHFDFGLSSYSQGSAAGDPEKNDPDSPPPYNPEEGCPNDPLSGGTQYYTESFTTGCREVTLDVEESQTSSDGSVRVSLESMYPKMNKAIEIKLNFTDADGNPVQNINYDLTAEQNGSEVLSVLKAHSDSSSVTHTTETLTSDEKVDVNVTILGIGDAGDESNWTEPIGKDVSMQVVPEFGSIAALVLAISIVAIITITSKYKAIPNL